MPEIEFLNVLISKTQSKENSDGFVLGVFLNSSRNNERFISTNYIALNFDSGNRLQEIQARFKDYWHITYTSLSHTEQNQIFRLLLKLSKPLLKNDYKG